MMSSITRAGFRKATCTAGHKKSSPVSPVIGTWGQRDRNIEPREPRSPHRLALEIKWDSNAFVLDLMRALHPAPERARIQTTSQITIVAPFWTRGAIFLCVTGPRLPCSKWRYNTHRHVQRAELGKIRAPAQDLRVLHGKEVEQGVATDASVETGKNRRGWRAKERNER